MGVPYQQQQGQLDNQRPDDVFKAARDKREQTERDVQNQASRAPDETPEATTAERTEEMEREAEERFKEIGDKQG